MSNRRKMKKGVFVFLAVCFFSLVCGFSAAAGENYPEGPITFLLAYSPGGGTDASNKALIAELEKELKVPIIPKYVVGAAASLCAYELSKAKPDGYTIGNTTCVAMALVPHTVGVKYDPLKDFDFLGTFIQFTVGYMVKADSPFQNLKDLIEAARKNPETIRYGNQTPGGFLGLAAAYLEKAENVRFKNVPYPGGSSKALSALLGGHVDFMANNPAGIKPYVKSEHVRMLFSASSMRHSDMSVPTLRELGYDFDQVSWNAVGAPQGLRPEVRTKLENAIAKAVKAPKFVQTMKNLDTPVDYHDGQDYTNLIKKYYKLWGDLLAGGYRF